MTKCKQCGFCCKVIIAETSEELVDIVSERVGFVGIVKYGGQLYAIYDNQCRHLTKDNKCRLYDRKPKICEVFPNNVQIDFWKLVNPNCGYVKSLP